MTDLSTISIADQAAEVRNVALGEQARMANSAWQKRHGSTGWSIARKQQQINSLFAAADTLDRLAADASANIKD